MYVMLSEQKHAVYFGCADTHTHTPQTIGSFVFLRLDA
jgi:hypothetical protein